MLFRFVDLSISPLAELFENLIDAVDVTHGGLPADPIDDDGPLERIEVTFRLGEDLVGSGRGAPGDKARYAAVGQVRFDRLELVLGGKIGDDFEVELERTLRMAWRIRAASGRTKEFECSIGVGYTLTMAGTCV